MNKPAVYLNENGFLLIEQLMSLILVSLLSVLLTQSLMVYTRVAPTPNTLTVADLEAVASQLQQEATYKTQFYAPTSSKLGMKTPGGDSITYFIKNNQLIRQKNSEGHEIVLYHCQSLEVKIRAVHAVELVLTCSSHSPFRIYLSTFYTPIDQFITPKEEVTLHEEVK